MSVQSFQAMLRSTRPPFLILAPACIFLGVACAQYSGFSLRAVDLALVFIGGLLAHVSVNTFNEYYDFSSGLDTLTEKTPFSGGSGALVETPRALPWVLACAVFSLLLTTVIGVYFLMQAGPAVVPLGLMGAAVIVAYTKWINRFPWLCLVAPGLGFGPLMVVGTQAALTGVITPFSLVVSLIPFFLVNNLLLLNQLPDIEADKRVGRNHLPIAYGIQFSSWTYLCFVIAAGLLLVGCVGANYLPVWSLLALLPLSAGIVAAIGVLRVGREVAKLLPFLGLNVLSAVATPALLAATLMFSVP